MMVDELRTLLREAVAAPPEDVLDVHDVARQGARARRRRTTLQAAAAGLAVAAVVGGAALVGGTGGSGTAPDPAERPGLQLTLADAVPADGGPVAEAEQTVAGTTEDGLGLLWDENESPAGYSVRIGLLDPQSGRETWLPDSPATLTQPVELSAERLVFLVEVPRVGPRLGIFDRTSGEWRLVTWEGLSGTFTAVAMGPEGRVWFDQGGRLVSGSLTDPTDLRDEGTVGGTFDIDGTTLASVAEDGSRLTVTDLMTDESRSYAVPSPTSSCAPPSLDLGDKLVALSWSCSYGDLRDPGPTDARAVVMSTAGEVVADVAGLPGNIRLDARVTGDDVLLTSPSPQTSYDPEVCSFPFDGLPGSYLDRWSDRVDQLATEQGTPDGWEYCQLSHEVYQDLVLPHLDEAQVPERGYGYYVIDGATGSLRQLTTSTPYVTGWGFSGDGRIPAGTAIWD